MSMLVPCLAAWLVAIGFGCIGVAFSMIERLRDRIRWLESRPAVSAPDHGPHLLDIVRVLVKSE